ncbi:WD40-repeat-containing domain protein [Mucor mucedo]|uniref:WD40-repeat-containing domain protein n=1 Tax=Mucor mucedo TaxID=29922 RepID=UPI002220A872|nr:WD40-repeat-containing domain protein [Mucor mucedo]KAI7890999.1 WD40-repeat-containing domain protein [Mucor mucedo]
MSQSNQSNIPLSDPENNRRPVLQPPLRTQQSNSWPSLSSIMALFSGSRSEQDQVENKHGNETIDEELSCPICQDLMNEVFSTNCGHSYCYQCIKAHIEQQTTCPLCRSVLTRAEIHPNFQLNKLAQLRIKALKENNPERHVPIERIIQNSNGDCTSIAKLLSSYLPHKDLVEILETAITNSKETGEDRKKEKNEMMQHFLGCLKKENEQTIDTLIAENGCIDNDFTCLDNKNQTLRKRRYAEIESNNEEEKTNYDQKSITPQSNQSTNTYFRGKFHDLTALYRTTFTTDLNIEKRRKLMDVFSTTMYDLTKFSYFDEVDSLNYTESSATSSIVSSIEFDRDQEFFAMGGVTRQIKIYDYNLIGQKCYSNTLHCPVRSINCLNKISCLSWSPYIKSLIASSDYQGIIDIWDVTTGQKTQKFTEHLSRAWSVDICAKNPDMLASGGDDSTVKVWSLSQNTSLYTLEQNGNVCCAKFSPNNIHHIAVGCAGISNAYILLQTLSSFFTLYTDHGVSFYDLRFPNEPVKIFEGHKKAVSYVKWLNDEEIISASIDSTLKLWDVNSTDCKMTFDGHQNEKNFVGLSLNGDWITCGSENNTVYTYHKASQHPVATFDFADNGHDENTPTADISATFVSSVCWKKGTTEMIAANSKGLVKILEMK